MPTREQRQLMKTMDKLFKQKYAIVAKKHGFKNNSFNAFKTVNDFFFNSFVNLNNVALFDNYLEIFITLQVKPLKIDDIYWEISGLEENKKQPLSFRANGVFVVQGPALLKRENITLKDLVPNEENLTKIVESGMELIDSKIELFLKKWTIDTSDVSKFNFVGLANDQKLMEMLLLIMKENYKEALILVDNQLNQNEKGRYYTTSGDSIYDLVKKFCERKMKQ